MIFLIDLVTFVFGVLIAGCGALLLWTGVRVLGGMAGLWL